MEQQKIIVQNSHGEKLVGCLHEAGSSDIVILCHGFLSTKEDNTQVNLAAALVKEGITVFRFDFSGNGESEGAFEFGNYRKEAEDLRAIIEYFKGVNRVTAAILGHSKGGNVVLLYASKYNDVDRVINVSGRYKLGNGIEERFGKDFFERIKKNGCFDVKSKDDSNTHNHVRKDVQTEAGEKVNTKKRETNYSEEEDILLCRAWMATDVDPVIGKGRSSMTLWGRIGEAYASLIGDDYVPRTEVSLANRWSRIRNTAAKFYSIYKNIAEQNQDSSELEKINMTALTFKKECKERFIFLSCWNELKHSPKWNFEIVSGVKFRRRHAAVFSQQSSNVEHFSHNDDDDSPVPTPTLFDQPQGKKLVAQKRKGQDVDTSSSDMEELLPQTQNLVREIYADQPEVEKLVVRKRKERDGETDLVRELLEQKVKKLDELLEIEREKRDTKIMLIDPTTLADGRRLYFEKLQQKILERVCGIPPPSN